MRQRSRLVLFALIGAVTVTMFADRAWAQGPSATDPNEQQRPATPRPRPRGRGEPMWTVTFHGGGALASKTTSGTGSVPAALPTVNLPGGLTSRPAPSWYFGDGTVIFNGLLSGSPAAITPLDSMLTSASALRHNGAGFGATISRRINARFQIEGSFDGLRTAPAMTSSALAAIETSRSTFASAWNFFLNGVPGQTVTSTTTKVAGSGFEWQATGAARVTVMSNGRNTIYALGGAGAVFDKGTSPSVTLTGHYAFTLINPTPNVTAAPFDETDVVTVHYVRASKMLGLFGVGWSRDVTRRMGINAELRVGVGGNGVSTVIDPKPTRILQSDSSKALLLAFAPSPALVFVNSGVFPFNSTLNAGPITSATTFKGSGMQIRTLFDAGVFFRF